MAHQTQAMSIAQSATRAAERLAALFDLAREHDDDVNYVEVKLLLTTSHPRLALRETPQPAQPARPNVKRKA